MFWKTVIVVAIQNLDSTDGLLPNISFYIYVKVIAEEDIINSVNQIMFQEILHNNVVFIQHYYWL